MSPTEYVMLGDGGHASSVWSALGELHVSKVALVASHAPQWRTEIERMTEQAILSMPTDNTVLINGLGQMNPDGPRVSVFDMFTANGYRFLTVTHPFSHVDSLALLGEAVHVLAGAVVGPGSRVDDNTILNTGSIIEHGCTVGKHVHVGPGATVCGDVTIGDQCIIGPGVTVVRGTTIGARSVIAAGAVVTTDVAPDSVMMGIPARQQGL